jgi:hypothetical protein
MSSATPLSCHLKSQGHFGQDIFWHINPQAYFSDGFSGLTGPGLCPVILSIK